jgi:hypothetical protein
MGNGSPGNGRACGGVLDIKTIIELFSNVVAEVIGEE